MSSIDDEAAGGPQARRANRSAPTAAAHTASASRAGGQQRCHRAERDGRGRFTGDDVSDMPSWLRPTVQEMSKQAASCRHPSGPVMSTL